ncbi:hypothetical protein ACQW02_05060 [Humitalea sp. 24SJ18S-53]|uniref:T4 family baseplate hub assembly chaperone n=1 Tax=Humitalea sp. 24SJ18S-53 TaxID=3422307 RepID=UPI003D6688F1
MRADPSPTPRGLDAAGVIAAWEAGPDPAMFGLHPDQPLGMRMRDVLGIRIASFGPVLDAVADCPDCGAALDVALDLRDLLRDPPPDDAPCHIAAEGFYARVRAPTAADLHAAALAPDPARALFEACILDATHGDTPVPPKTLPDSLRIAATEVLGARDPLIEVTVSLTCPDCGAVALAGLDAEALLAQDIAAAAPRLLAEVAALARAYGWAEAEILALPAARRRAYLDLAG